MSDKIIFLRQTTDGIVSDTILKNKDTLSIDVSGAHSIVLPESPIDVNTPGKDWFDYTVGTITLIGALIAAFYTWKLIKKLYKKDEDKQIQIDKLSGIAEKLEAHNLKVEAQNEIMREGNELLSKQVDTLSKMSLGQDTQGISDLAKIENQKLELEHRPKIYYSNKHSAGTVAKYEIVNNGKPFTIKSLTVDNENICVNLLGQYNDRMIDEKASLWIETTTSNENLNNENRYILMVLISNELGIEYLAKINSNESLGVLKCERIDANE